MEKCRQRKRGEGRAELVRAALGAVDSATLSDVLSFVTGRRLRELSGRSNGAIYSSFKSPTEVARRAVLLAIKQLGAPEPDPQRHPAESNDARQIPADDHLFLAGGREVQRLATGSRRHVLDAVLLATAVVDDDDEARRALEESYARRDGRHVQRCTQLLSTVGHEPSVGMADRDISVILTCMLDGLAVRARTDSRIDHEFTVRALACLWSGLTARPGSHEADSVLTLAMSGALPDAQCDRDPVARERVAEAVRWIYRHSGWAAVGIRAVSERADVSPLLVVAQFGDRDGLSVAVWSGLVEQIQRDIDDGARLPAVARVRRFLTSLARAAYDHPFATESLLRSIFSHTSGRRGSGGRPDPTDPTDPRHEVGLPMMLADILGSSPSAFKIGIADSYSHSVEYSTFLVNALLLRSLTRPSHDPAAVADYVIRICVDGSTTTRRPRP